MKPGKISYHPPSGRILPKENITHWMGRVLTECRNLITDETPSVILDICIGMFSGGIGLAMINGLDERKNSLINNIILGAASVGVVAVVSKKMIPIASNILVALGSGYWMVATKISRAINEAFNAFDHSIEYKQTISSLYKKEDRWTIAALKGQSSVLTAALETALEENSTIFREKLDFLNRIQKYVLKETNTIEKHIFKEAIPHLEYYRKTTSNLIKAIKTQDRNETVNVCLIFSMLLISYTSFTSLYRSEDATLWRTKTPFKTTIADTTLSLAMTMFALWMIQLHANEKLDTTTAVLGSTITLGTALISHPRILWASWAILGAISSAESLTSDERTRFSLAIVLAAVRYSTINNLWERTLRTLNRSKRSNECIDGI